MPAGSQAGELLAHVSKSVRAELVEAPPFLCGAGRREGRPFDRLRANGVLGVDHHTSSPSFASASSCNRASSSAPSNTRSEENTSQLQSLKRNSYDVSSI